MSRSNRKRDCRTREDAKSIVPAGTPDWITAELIEQTIRVWQHMGNRGAIANMLECFAFLALARGDRVRVARLFGAAESLRQSAGAGMASHEREEYEAAVARMRLDADGLALDEAWAEGRRLGAEAAIEFAVTQDETKRDQT